MSWKNNSRHYLCKGSTPGSNCWIVPKFVRTVTMENYTLYKAIVLNWPASYRSQLVMSHFFYISTHLPLWTKRPAIWIRHFKCIYMTKIFVFWFECHFVPKRLIINMSILFSYLNQCCPFHWRIYAALWGRWVKWVVASWYLSHVQFAHNPYAIMNYNAI